MKKNSEVYKEQIGILKNEMTHLWGSMFVIGGGSLTLFINYQNPLTNILCSLGFFLTILFLKTYFAKRTEIIYILREMEAL